MSTDFATLVLQLKSSPFDKPLETSTSKLSAFEKAASGVAQSLAGFFAASKLSAFAQSSIKSFAAQEDSVNNLKAALNAADKSFVVYAERYKDFASQMQDMTKYGDDFIIQQMASAQNLGITSDKLNEAAKAAAGLAAKYSNLNMESAMLLLGRASQGHTEMLARYGIKLKEGASEQEKFNELLKIGVDNFALAKAQANTTTGQIAQLANAWDDFKEVTGDAFIKGLALNDMLKSANTTIKDLTKWLEGVDDGYKIFAVRMAIGVTGLVAIRGAVTAVSGVLAVKNSLIAAGTRNLTENTAAIAANAIALKAHQAAAAADMAFSDKYNSFDLLSAPIANMPRMKGGFGRGAPNRAYFNRSIGASSIPQMKNLAGGLVKTGGATLEMTAASTALPFGGIFKAASKALPVVGSVYTIVDEVYNLVKSRGTEGGFFSKMLLEVTGLGAAMDSFFGSLFYGLDEAKERSAELDKQMQKLKEKQAKKAQEKIEEQKSQEWNKKWKEASKDYEKAAWEKDFSESGPREQIAMLEEKRQKALLEMVSTGDIEKYWTKKKEVLEYEKKISEVNKDLANEYKKAADSQKEIKDMLTDNALKNAKNFSSKMDILEANYDKYMEAAGKSATDEEQLANLKKASSFADMMRDEEANAPKARVETTVADAVRQGSFEALKLENMTITKPDQKALDYSKKTEENTKKTVEALTRLLNKITESGTMTFVDATTG